MFGVGTVDGKTGAAEGDSKKEEKKETSLFGGSLNLGNLFSNNPLFGNTGNLFGGAATGSLFNTSTLTSGSLGSNLIGNNPFASYNTANLRKEGEEDESNDEEDKAPSEHDAGDEIVKEQLQPSPYTKLVSVILKD